MDSVLIIGSVIGSVDPMLVLEASFLPLEKSYGLLLCFFDFREISELELLEFVWLVKLFELLLFFLNFLMRFRRNCESVSFKNET